MILRARHLVPVAAPSIEDGAVRVSGKRIVAAGRWSELRREGTGGGVLDLGDVALLPGLINAHCHLDYTHFAGHLPPPRSFTEWIQGVLALKAGWSFSEYAASWLSGAQQLVSSGCTTVVDIEAVPELLPDAWLSTPLRVISAFEITGVRSGRSPEDLIGEVLARGEALRDSRNRFGLSPHAPYSTRPELMAMAARVARDRGLPLTTHVGESAEEFAMFRHGEGPMHQWLGPQRGTSDCGRVSPVGLLGELGVLGQGTLAVHANYLDREDPGLLAGSGTTVVHCPRSHDYFGHQPFPLGILRRAGVSVCLGTDSMISVRRKGRSRLELDFFEELREFRSRHPALSPIEVLSMVTRIPARALGLEGILGAIQPGAWADVVVVPLEGSLGTAEAEGAVLEHQGPVRASMIEGAWVLPPPAMEQGEGEPT